MVLLYLILQNIYIVKMEAGLTANFVLKSCEQFFNLKKRDSASLLRAEHAFAHLKEAICYVTINNNKY